MSSNSKFAAWIKAARLRTLPLAISGISLGALLAVSYSVFRWDVFIWAILTSVLLQVVSNFANDYGDFSKGVDSDRADRALGSGSISQSQMRTAIFVLVALTFASGIYLLSISFTELDAVFMMFMILGILSIGAAILYTVGKFAYGYRGLGDVMVFLFFGILSVSGSFFLFLGQWAPAMTDSLWVASSMGLLSTAVLNVNNIRDLQGDKANGKNTLPVFLGRERALWYQLMLTMLPLAMAYVYLQKVGIQSWTMLLICPFYLLHWFRLRSIQPEDRERHNALLKWMVLLSLFFVLTFGILLLTN